MCVCPGSPNLRPTSECVAKKEQLEMRAGLGDFGFGLMWSLRPGKARPKLVWTCMCVKDKEKLSLCKESKQGLALPWSMVSFN